MILHTNPMTLEMNHRSVSSTIDDFDIVSSCPSEEDDDDDNDAGDGDDDEGGHHQPVVKEQIRDYVSNTTFHGLDQIFNGSTFARIFWSVVIVCVLVIVVFQLKTLVSFFLQNPTLTSISVVFPEQGLSFPPITICTLAKLNQSRLREKYSHMKNKTAEFATAAFFSAFSTTLMDVGYFGADKGAAARLQHQLNSDLRGQAFPEFLEDVTFSCSKQFLYCWFQNGEILPCCSSDPSHPIRVKRYLIHSGPCYTFTVDASQRLPGPVGGLGFAYWYPNEALFPSVFNSYDEHGVHLYASPSEAMLEKNPTSLQVGTHNHISLEATHTKRLSFDQLGRRTCIPKELKLFDKYSYASCQVECMLQKMLEQCGCVGLASYSNLKESDICSPQQAFSCYKSLAHNFTRLLIQCRQAECSEACDYWSYKASVSAGRVFNPKLSDNMRRYWRLPTDNPPEQSLIIADVYFPDIQYTEIEQQPAVTIEGFISNIGGAMGLWTGASIITWIHLVYFCCSACLLRRRRAEEKARLYAAAETQAL